MMSYHTSWHRLEQWVTGGHLRKLILVELMWIRSPDSGGSCADLFAWSIACGCPPGSVAAAVSRAAGLSVVDTSE